MDLEKELNVLKLIHGADVGGMTDEAIKERIMKLLKLDKDISEREFNLVLEKYKTEVNGLRE
jgi:hypothetical protein